MTELHDLTAVAAAAAVANREVSPVELVRSCLDRIERLDGDLGAFVLVTPESALQQAGEAERRVLSGEPLPPLFGVPTAIKDLNQVRGVRTRLGSAAFGDLVPEFDDDVVRLLRSGGTISLGKTATPELGLPCYTESDVAPPTRTPWDTRLTAGGSSGGAAAAVAAGLLPLAQGSDGGGSIRIPASINGLFGLKPSRGRIPRGPLGADPAGLGVSGPLSRTVLDAAAFLDVTATPQVGEPSWAPPLPSGETFVGWCQRDPGRLRIGRYIDPPIPGAVISTESRQAWEAASVLLSDLGHDVVDVEQPVPPHTIDVFEIVWAVGAASAPVDPAREHLLRPLTRWLRARGRPITGAQYVTAVSTLATISRAHIQATDGLDAILTPTLASLAPPIGWFCGTPSDPVDPAEDFHRQKMFTPFTAVYNASGQPAASLPLHMAARPDGSSLPVGVMLVGRPAGDAPLLSLCAQIERAAPWVDRHPACW